MKSLRIQVERVVRPIVASPARKDRMREELLAHLTQMFEEEGEKTEDEPAAIVAAVRRFGDATELTRELQATVPWIERAAFVSPAGKWKIERRVDESPARFIVRSNAWGLAISLAGYVLLLALGLLIIHNRPHRADQCTPGQLIVFFLEAAAIQGMAMLGGGLLCDRARVALEMREVTQGPLRNKATRRFAGYVAAGTGVIVLAFTAGMLAVDHILPFSLISRAQFFLLLFAATVIILPLTLWQILSWRTITRRFELWESLDLSPNGED